MSQKANARRDLDVTAVFGLRQGFDWVTPNAMLLWMLLSLVELTKEQSPLERWELKRILEWVTDDRWTEIVTTWALCSWSTLAMLEKMRIVQSIPADYFCLIYSKVSTCLTTGQGSGRKWFVEMSTQIWGVWTRQKLVPGEVRRPRGIMQQENMY